MTYTVAEFIRETHEEIIANLTPEERLAIIDEMPSDERRALIERPPPDERRALIAELPPEERLSGLTAADLLRHIEFDTLDAESREMLRKVLDRLK